MPGLGQGEPHAAHALGHTEAQRLMGTCPGHKGQVVGLLVARFGEYYDGHRTQGPAEALPGRTLSQGSCGS